MRFNISNASIIVVQSFETAPVIIPKRTIGFTPEGTLNISPKIIVQTPLGGTLRVSPIINQRACLCKPILSFVRKAIRTTKQKPKSILVPTRMIIRVIFLCSPLASHCALMCMHDQWPKRMTSISKPT